MHDTAGRFFKRRLIAYFSLILIPLTLFSSLSILFTRASMRADVESNSLAVLYLLEDGIDYILDEMRSFTMAFNQSALYARVSTMLTEPGLSYASSVSLHLMQEWVRSIVDSRPYIESLYIYIQNDYGRALTNEGLTSLRTMPDTKWVDIFNQHKQAKYVWTIKRTYARSGFTGAGESRVVSIFQTMRDKRGVIVMNLSSTYMARQLADSNPYEDQLLLILNDQNEPMLSNGDISGLPIDELTVMIGEADNPSSFRFNGYAVTALPPNDFGWRFLALMPEDALYRLPNNLFKVSLLMLLPCLALSALLAYRRSQNEHRQLQTLFEITDAAENGRPLPSLYNSLSDEYGHIEQNILAGYVTQNNLKMALQEKNYQLKSSELLALQAQINPHFLVNTLNTVFWKALALTGGPNEVSSMIEDFTQLLAQLMGDPNECVPLSEEMRCLQSYIDIQKRRFPDRFTYTTNIDPVIGDAAILKLILQPIVENCISHALVPEREINIQVDVCVRGDSIELTVKDDGAGMTAEVLERLRVPSDQHQYKHIGLYNTMKRLALFYNVDSPLTIDSCEGNGTIVRISVPMI